jgi:hypothetical protein
VLGLGSGVEAVAPVELREAIGVNARAALAAYR